MCALPRESVPVEIRRTDQGVDIRWSSGEETSLPGEYIRRHCPCAECREKRGDTSHAKPLTGGAARLTVLSASVDEETHLAAVWPVGNYALGVQWGDKHNSGIYTYDHLRTLAGKYLKETD